MDRPVSHFVVGGLTPNITEADLKGRFSAIKNLTVKSVEIILREDGVCKGFAYINTNEDDEDAISKLIKLYNGSKWKGRVLKVEKAKPSYLERMKEETNNNHPIEETKVEEEKPEPLSGIPNTIMIRKSKRKFLVVSLNTIHRDENGYYLGDTDHTTIPKTVEVPVKNQDNEMKPTSTKKHRFIQPEVTCFDDKPSKSSIDLWKPIEAPKRNSQAVQMDRSFHIVKSSIQLDDDFISSNEPPKGLLSESEEEPPFEERGVVTFSDHDDETPVVPPYYESSEDESLRKDADCCVEAVCQKREWREKRAEIDVKRQRVEMEVLEEEEEEDLENLNLEAENQKLTGILHSMIGTKTVQNAGVVDFGDEGVEMKPEVKMKTKEAIREMAEKEQINEMQSLFDDKNVNSFSLFNFLPSDNQKAEQTQESTEKANILDTLAPTAWYNETKPTSKTTMITIPLNSNTTSVVSQQERVRRDFSNFFYRTRSMEDVEKEWEQLRPGLVSDYERKKKNAKKAWKHPSDSGRKGRK